MHRKISVFIVGLICLCPLHSVSDPKGNSQSLPTRYAVQDLGLLPGYDMAVAAGLNDKSEVVGVALRSVHFDQQAAFVWRKGKITALPAPGSEASYVHAINHRGDSIGYGRMPDGKTRPILWAAGHQTNPLWLTDTEGAAYALNEKGQILVSDAKGIRLWPSSEILSIVPPQDKFVRLTGLNAREDVIGFFARNGGEFSPTLFEQPFLYQKGKVTILQTLDGKRSVCEAINNTGLIVGWAEDAQRKRHACCWKEGVLQELSVPESKSSEARALNDAGIIAGNYHDMKLQMHACLWWNGEVVDLNTRLAPNSGWILHYANGINNRGQIIGSGFFKGGQRAFSMTPLK